MAARQKAAEVSEAEAPQITHDDVQEGQLSSWEFVNRIPTTDDVLSLLGTLPPVWGVQPADFVEFVQGLPSSKKVKVRAGGRVESVFVDVVTLYMSVAGRVAMLNAAQMMNGWRVEVVPAETVPTLPPGFMQMDDRIVYREKVTIWESVEDVWVLKGSRTGQAWTRASGGSGAAETNPYEKVETSARGRAIAAWGFGVLPGSGIASLEEMQSIARGQSQNRPPQQQEPEPGQERQTPEDVLTEIHVMNGELAQLTGMTEAEMEERNAKFVSRTFGDKHIDEAGLVAWPSLNVGQLTVMQRSVKTALARARTGAA